MPDDTGTQYAGLTDAERVLARADDHMSTCDEPQMADCETCTRRIGKYRRYLDVLADAGLLIQPYLDSPNPFIEAIRQREQAATPGPWWAWDRGVGIQIAVGEPGADGRPRQVLQAGDSTDIGRWEDGEFIAHARQDVPLLLAELDLRQRAIDSLMAEVSRLVAEQGASPHTGPRVWAMPQIPPDVVKVRAAFDGSIWVRHGKGWVDVTDRFGGDGDPNPEVDLIADLGPLTEVLPNA